MAGHSKWANIKYRKGRADAKRGKIFSRAAKEIITAVKLGGADPKTNARLRAALDKARAASVPNDVIERNIKKGTSSDQSEYTEMTYELYGYGGVGIVLDIMTDNKNRISSNVRIATNKCGGSVVAPGSVIYNFERKGIIQIPKQDLTEEKLFDVIIESGGQDFEVTDELYIVTTDPIELISVKDAITERGIQCSESSIDLIPKTYVECDPETLAANQKLIDWLEEIDEVDAVYHNMS